MSWMEERRFDWVPQAANALSKLLEGHALLLLTDDDRTWFGEYIMTHLNRSVKNRPFLPIYNLHASAPSPKNIKNEQELTYFFDMLDLTHKEYFFWYVGRYEDTYMRFIKNRDDNFTWIFDQEVQNSFFLRSYDDLLDFKLLHMFRLFDKSIDAVLSQEVDLGL